MNLVGPIEPRWTCCGIFFGRFNDYASHQFDKHYEPNEEMVEAIIKWAARAKANQIRADRKR